MSCVARQAQQPKGMLCVCCQPESLRIYVPLQLDGVLCHSVAKAMAYVCQRALNLQSSGLLVIAHSSVQAAALCAIPSWGADL